MRFIIQIPYKVPKEVFKVDKSFKPRSMVTKRTIEVTKAFGLGIDEEKEFTIFKNFEVEINLGEVVLTYGASGIEKMALRDFEQKLNELEVKNPHPHVALVSSERLEPQMSIMDPKTWRSIGQIVMSREGAMKMALELKRVAATPTSIITPLTKYPEFKGIETSIDFLKLKSPRKPRRK